MPLIKSAIKKLRKDKVRTVRNQARKLALKNLIKKARLAQNPTNLQAVFSALDKAAKVKLIHPNKASRLKSRLSKLVAQPSKGAAVTSVKRRKSQPKAGRPLAEVAKKIKK